jgi:hypothetical protein
VGSKDWAHPTYAKTYAKKGSKCLDTNGQITPLWALTYFVFSTQLNKGDGAGDCSVGYFVTMTSG